MCGWRMSYPLTPCIGICELQGEADRQYCKGCLRSAFEIETWFQRTDEDKEKVIRILPFRKQWLELLR